MGGTMGNKGGQASLLELLAVRSCCTYLSNLHHPLNLPQIQHAVQGLEPSSFSLAEWNDAVRYITGEDVTFPSREETFQYLMNRRDRRAAE